MSGTVLEALDRVVDKWGNLPALQNKRGGNWEGLTWKEYSDQAHLAARGFMALGLEAGKGVAIIGYNRPKWFLADIAGILAGAVPAGIYTTSAPEQCQYISGHCDAQVAVVEDPGQLAKFKKVWGELPQLKAIVMMDGSDEAENVLSWDELIAKAEEVPAEELEQRKQAQKADDLCTLIYTSGTTGPPKAVMMTHRNFTWTAEAVVDHVGGFGPDDNVLSYLPLSHVAEQLLSIHMPMVIGGTIYCLQDLLLLGDTLREVRPGFFLGVPRVWEKIQAKIVAAAAGNSPLKKKIGLWAKGVGKAGGYAEQRGESKPFFYGLANKLVFSKVKDLLGLDRCKIAVSSTAPIAKDTLEFFLSLGIPLCEVYGMSECTGPATLCHPGKYRTGFAGYALPGTEIKIADDGEVCMKGPHVMPGYLKNEEATAETLDSDGWLHSGDIGELTDDGYLKITDRKKELIITAGGKNIAPQPIEASLMRDPLIGQAVVIGDSKPYLTALLGIDPDARAQLAAQHGLSEETDLESLVETPGVKAQLERKVAEVNARLPRFEQIKRWSVLPAEMTVESGELTPTMKVKRRVVHQRYADRIDEMYG